MGRHWRGPARLVGGRGGGPVGLDRNGQAPLPQERGPKDVAYVGENETVRVIMRFGPHPGRYMTHCHNLVHEDHDMMGQFVVGSGGHDPMSAARARSLPAPTL